MRDEPAADNPRFLEWKRGLARANPPDENPLLGATLREPTDAEMKDIMRAMFEEIVRLRYELATKEAVELGLSGSAARQYVVERVRGDIDGRG